MYTSSTIIATFIPLLGDVNHDGEIDIVDVLLVAQYKAGLDPQPFYPEQADLNNDGNIDMTDAFLILDYYSGKISEFPNN